MEKVGRAHQTVVNGTSIAWSEMGSGLPLVLLHGLGDSHRTWRLAAPLLARDFRVLMPDLPGHGWSGRPDASYTLAWYTRTVAGWMDAIGVTSAHVCGHAFGGGIAQWMLLDDRARVDRMALVAPGGAGQEVSLATRLAASPLLGLALAPPLMWLGVLAGPWFFPERFGHKEPEEVRLLVRMNRVRGTTRAFRRSLADVVRSSGQPPCSIERAHERASLPAIALFWGVKDPVIPIRQATTFLDCYKGITLTVYPGCGHVPQLDGHPAFARDLGEFLSDPRRASALVLPRA
jgi:pimeloyl-ACP methyl ester carboxylesterase